MRLIHNHQAYIADIQLKIIVPVFYTHLDVYKRQGGKEFYHRGHGGEREKEEKGKN